MAKKAAASGTSAQGTPATKARTSSAPAPRASSTAQTRAPSAAPGPVTGTRAKPAASDLSVEAVAKEPEPLTGSIEAASNAATEPSHEQIAQRAFELYQARGGYGGEEMSDWLRAERELRGSR